MRNILCRVSKSAKQEVANALKTIFAQASRKKAEAEAHRVIAEFEARFPETMRTLEDSLDEVLTFYRFPQEHREKIFSSPNLSL